MYFKEAYNRDYLKYTKLYQIIPNYTQIIPNKNIKKDKYIHNTFSISCNNKN